MSCVPVHMEVSAYQGHGSGGAVISSPAWGPGPFFILPQWPLFYQVLRVAYIVTCP